VRQGFFGDRAEGKAMTYVPLHKKLSQSDNKSETMRWWFRAYMKRKKVLFHDEAERLWSKLKKHNTGRWHLTFDIYVYYGKSCCGVRMWSTHFFKKQELKDRFLTMQRVVQLEMDLKKRGGFGSWV